MAPRQEAQFPFKGRSDATAKGSQPGMTTQAAKNVVGWIPKTEQMQGGQRPGLSPYLSDPAADSPTNAPLSAEGTPIQYGTTVSYDRPAFDYVQLGDKLDDTPQDTPLTENWTHPSPNGSPATRVKLDAERNSYWLSGELIIKRNAEGTDLFHVPIPLTQNQVIAPALEIDLDGNIYVAASSAVPDQDSSVFKFVPREDDKGMDLAWEMPVEQEEIAALAFEFGRILIAGNTPGAKREAALYAVDDLTAEEPTIVLALDAPFPIGDIAVGPEGTYITCPPSTKRGPDEATDGFVESLVDWTPHDLVQSEDRLHFWVDASELGTYADGARVGIWPDRRFVEVGAVAPIDDTNRYLRSHITGTEYGDSYGGYPEGPRAPRYRANAAQAMPGLVFDADEGRRENNNHGAWTDKGTGIFSGSPTPSSGFPLHKDKVTVSDSMTNSPGMWPHTLTQSWAFSMVFRWVAGVRPSVVWLGTSVKSNIAYQPTEHNWAIVCNFDAATYIANAGNGNDLKDDSPVLATFAAGGQPLGGVGTYGDDWAAPGLRYQLDGGVALIRDNVIMAYGAANTSLSTDTTETNMAIVTLMRQISGTPVELRINGGDQSDGVVTETSSWATVLDESNVTHTREAFGTRVWDEEASSSHSDNQTHKLQLAEFDSFSGSLHEVITWFGDSSVDTSPGNQNIDEYEDVEGYLAWKWGCARNVLHTSHDHATAVPGSGSGFTAETDTATADALISRQGILARVKPNLLGFQWAINGAGLGYGVVADTEGGVICIGPRAADASIPLTEVGPQGRVLLKGIDRGLQFDWPEPARGQFVIHSTPQNGASVTVHDGVASEKFIFHSVSDPGGGTWITTAVNDPDTIRALLEAAITLSTTINMYGATSTVHGSSLWPQNIELHSREAATATPHAITTAGLVASPNEEITVSYGMTGPGVSPVGTWDLRVQDHLNVTDQNVQMATDVDSKVYVPYTLSYERNRIVKYSQNGDGNNAAQEIWTHRIGGGITSFSVKAVALDPVEEDLFPANGPGSIWVATTNIDALGVQDVNEETHHRIDAVRSTPYNGLSRETTTLAVSGGNLYKLDRAVGSVVVSGGAVAGAASVWVQGATLFGEVFFCDAGTYKVYNLKKNTVRDWQVKGSGQMPEDARLLAAYRGRVVLARAKEDPHNLHASAQGDPYNWNLGAPTDDVTRAFSGSQSETARNPDLINAIAPFFDDRLVIGGDRTITLFSGDLSELGRADLFTDSTGMAFGSTHALDPEGFIYFFGSRGGVWAMSPAAEGRSSPPVELTEQTIASELGQLDLTIYRPHLVWDQEMRALFVYVVRRDPGTSAAVVQQWMFEKRSKAWWPVTIDAATKQPTAAWISDGDLPGDRVHIIGCEDGRIRWWNPESRWDDGTRIDSSVLIGPLSPQTAGFEAKLTSLEVTLAEGAARYEVYASDNPADQGVALASGRVTQGFSGSLRHRIRGGTIWIRIFNASESETWRLESAFVNLEAAGRRRVR
ncbi:MAG: hypothetical protein OSB57_04195 [Planctomycetota bacterium]|nr:hypothetical protein [Planctomycetota bacterium]